MNTLMHLGAWLSGLRPLLEALYFLSAIALAIFAYRGLEQLRITREIANKNTQREAFKLAAEQCRDFAAQIVPMMNKAHEEYRQLKMTCCANPKFDVVKGEIVEHNFNLEVLKKEFTGDRPALVGLLNGLEGFALFFVSGIAEEDVGFRETATAFCGETRCVMPLIYAFRTIGVRYESTVKLYEIWNNRMQSEALTKQKQTIDERLQGINKQTIKTLGT